MPAPYEAATAALDGLEALCTVQAFKGTRAPLERLEDALEAYVEADGYSPGTERPSELIWQLFDRLRAAVEAGDVDAIRSASSDVRMELVALEDGRQAA